MSNQQNRSYVKKVNSNFQPNSFSNTAFSGNFEVMHQMNPTREATEKENEMEWLEDDNLDEDALFRKQIDKEKIKKQLESGEYQPKNEEESRYQRNMPQNQSSNNYNLNNQMNKSNNNNQKGYKPGYRPPQNQYQENPYQNNPQQSNNFNPGFNSHPKYSPNLNHKQQNQQGNQYYNQIQHSQYVQQHQQQQQQYGINNQFTPQQQWQQYQYQGPVSGQYQQQVKQNNQGYNQQKYYQHSYQQQQQQQQQQQNPYYQQKWQQQWLLQQQWQQQLLFQQQMEGQSNNQSQTNILFSDYVIENQHDSSEQLWYFKDAQQITYGPYCSYDMDTWYNFRILNDDILVAFNQSKNFVPIKEFFNFVKPANKDKETQEEQDILEQKLRDLGLSGKDRLIFQSPQEKP